MKFEKSQILLAIIAAILVATNILLILQNIRLRSMVEGAKFFVTDVGYRFDDLNIKRLDGNEETLSFSNENRNTLLLVFSSNCEYCTQQYSAWLDLVQGLDKSKWQVLAVTADSDFEKLRDHLSKYGLESFKVVSMTKADLERSRMRFTPMTLALSPSGDVKKVWPGLWIKGFELPE